MTDGVIADYITPADEIVGPDGRITTDDLLDEVSLYNLYDDRDSPEQDAERILRITYPTSTLTTIIENTTEKLSAGTLPRGGHVIGGGYGSGKSHIELVLYHLLDSPTLGNEWLRENGIDASLPSETRTAALQMLNLDSDYERLSTAVGSYLDLDSIASADLPSVHDIRDAVGDTPTAVFLDEFERWFSMSAREDYQSDNLAFLQNLLEAAGRDDTPLCVYVSLLYEDDDVEAIVQRTNPFSYDLSSRRDEKIRFLIHRLVGAVDDPAGVEDLAREYTDVYRQNKQIQLEDYHEMEGRIERYYPFHPSLLDLLLDKYSEQRSHQDARGILRFLTHLLRDTYDSVDLVLTGDVDVFQYTNWFRYIDSELIGKYLTDYHRLGDPVNPDEESGEKEFAPYVESLLNIVLLHSLARGGEEGANKRQMLLGTIRKGESAHEIVQTFTDDVYGHAWHIHRINGEYAYDVDENPAARIEKKAEEIHKDDAIHRVERLVREDLFNKRNNVYIFDPVNTEQDIPDNKTLKIVVGLAAKKSYDDDFEALTIEQEREFANTLVLVTPAKRSSIDTNTGIIELGRKVVAGEMLDREEEVLPEGYDEIHDQNFQNLKDRVSEKFGTVHQPTGRGLFPEPLSVDDDGDFYEAVLEVVKPDTSQLRSDVETIVENAGGSGIQFQHLLNDFYRNPEHTTLTDEQELRDTVTNLCRDGVIRVGTYFEEWVGSLGSDTTLVHADYVQLTDDEDDEPATITMDATQSSNESQSGQTSSPAGPGGSTSSTATSEAQQVFECPQCGEELQGTSCDCGFEFDASDLEEGNVTVEGGDATDLVQTFENLQEEVEGEDLEGTSTTRFPVMGALDADDKPALIDNLDRELGVGWLIHTINLSYNGTLTADGVASRGLDADSLTDVEVDETLTISPDEPLSRNELLNDVLLQLDVPDDVSFEIWLEVEKDE
jgi:hypothetical protein